MRQPSPRRAGNEPGGQLGGAPGLVHDITDRLDARGPYRYHVQRFCLVCGFALIEGELRTHRGACARRRKTRLQRERRARRRQ